MLSRGLMGSEGLLSEASSGGFVVLCRSTKAMPSAPLSCPLSSLARWTLLCWRPGDEQVQLRPNLTGLKTNRKKLSQK